MPEIQLSPTPSHRIHQLASDFRRLGWLGFSLQITLGVIPLFMLVFVLFFKTNITPRGRGLSLFGIIFCYGSLLALVFTLYWCFRYTRIAKRLEDSHRRPQRSDIIRCLWIGLLSNIIGMGCAVLVGMSQVGSFLLKTLLLPPGAATIYNPVPGATVFNPGSIITPFDMIALQAIINAIAAQLVGIIIALWLLSKVLKPFSRS